MELTGGEPCPDATIRQRAKSQTKTSGIPITAAEAPMVDRVFVDGWGGIVVIQLG